MALIGGVLLGTGIAHVIGRAHSFLNFGRTDGLRVGMTLPVLGYGILGIAIILLAQLLIPSLGAAENTIVTYKLERARLLRPPWWQRFWVDVILLVPAGVGLWILQSQSRRSLTGAQSAPDPLKNPLLLLVPAVAIFAASLLALRLIPYLMAFLSRILRSTKSVGTLMATRYLSRTPAFYTAPLVLLILTLGLSAFTASLAKTLDGQLRKQTFYEVGSDLSIQELGTSANQDATNPGAVWTFPPVEDHLTLKGVRAASRVGRYPATAVLADSALTGYFIGIDPATFPSVAYWQRNFASRSLGSLMNALGNAPDGVLIPQSLMESKNLQIGDTISIGVAPGTLGQSIVLSLRIVGTFKLFPTWYPSSGSLFVGNLDELYLLAGGDYPHDVWLRTASRADPESIVYAVRRQHHARSGRGPVKTGGKRTEHLRPGLVLGLLECPQGAELPGAAGAVRVALGRFHRLGTVDRAGFHALRPVLLPAAVYRNGHAPGDRPIGAADDRPPGCRVGLVDPDRHRGRHRARCNFQPVVRSLPTDGRYSPRPIPAFPDPDRVALHI